MFKKLTPLQQISTWLTVHTKPSLSGVNTPVELFDSMLDGVDLTGKSFLTLNYEAAILLAKKKVAAANITLVTNNLAAKSDMDLVGANTIFVDNESEALTKLQALDMKYDVVIGNPPYNEPAEERMFQDGNNRMSGSTVLAKKFFYLMLEKCSGMMLGLQPYSNKTFGKRVEATYKDLGLYKVAKVTSHFKVNQEIGAFYFDLRTPTEVLDNEFLQIEKPTNNLASRFVSVPGKLTRQQYEHTLLEEGTHRVIITPSVVRFTNDDNFIIQMDDSTRGSWRVAFPWNGSRDKIGQTMVVTPTDILSHNVGCIVVDSEVEATALAAYLQTEEVNAILRSIKTTCTNAKKYFEYIPTPTFLN